jgi:hypothetical protein
MKLNIQGPLPVGGFWQACVVACRQESGSFFGIFVLWLQLTSISVTVLQVLEILVDQGVEGL